MLNRAVILKPVVNEKSMALTKSGFYTFLIDRETSKGVIEKVVKEKFKVDVLSVKTINIKSKKKLQRSRKGYFYTSASKKAIIQVKKGQKIALFETITEEEKEKDEVVVKTAEGEVVAKEKKSLLRGTKVKIEKGGVNKEKVEKETDVKRPTKQSQKEKKKG